MACPAIPTCGLALSESERCLPDIVEQLEKELDRLGLREEKIAVRMTGCPNGCARPYQSDIGIVGRSGDKYTLFVGGNLVGDRLNFQLRDLVPLGQIVPTLVPILQAFKDRRQTGEGFGDFCHRLGLKELEKMLPPLPTKEGAKRDVGPDSGKPTAPAANGEAGAALPPLAAAMPENRGQPAVAPPRAETFYAGPQGEELPDYTFRYHSDGSIRETVVYYYGEDRRAAQAHPGTPLRREAVYQGQVNPYRLHAARKVCDIHYAGLAGQELRDFRREYHPDGTAAQTLVYYYEEDLRAAQASSGAVLRRHVSVAGTV
jgi:hypothetical protein